MTEKIRIFEIEVHFVRKAAKKLVENCRRIDLRICGINALYICRNYEAVRIHALRKYGQNINSLIVYNGTMSTAVYSIRLEDSTRQMMDEMTDINWQSEIRAMVEDLVREKKKQRFLAEARKLRQKMKTIGVSAADMIREDRDAR